MPQGWLARFTVAPLRDLERTANEVAGGDLTARAHRRRSQRSSTSAWPEPAHRPGPGTARRGALNTPPNWPPAAHTLTVLSVDVDAVDDPEIRERLDDDLASVHQMVDEIINTARRSSREGLHAKCDAAAVVGDRVQFWQVLAEDQGELQPVPCRPVPCPCA